MIHSVHELPCLIFYLAGNGEAENVIQAQRSVHDFDDVLNEFKDASTIKLYSQATTNKHDRKYLKQKKYIKGSATASTCPGKCNNSFYQRNGGVVKAQWGFFKKIGRAFKRVGKKIWRGIKKAGKKIWKGAKRLGRKVWKGLKKIGKKVWRGAKKFGKKIWRGVKKVAKKAWKGIKKTGKRAWKGIKKAGKWAWKGIKKVGKVALNFAKSPIGQTLIKSGLTALGVPPMVSGPLVGTVTGLADNLLGGSEGPAPDYGQPSPNVGPPSGYGQPSPNVGPPSGYGQRSPGYGQLSSYGQQSTDYGQSYY